MAEPRTGDTLGAVLRAARTEHGLSLRDVERRTGIRNAHLSQIETDTIAKPEMAILWELASLYEVDFGRLLALAGHARGGEESGGRRRRMTVALRALSELSPRDQEEALAFMAELKARSRDETGREPPSAHRDETGREPPSAHRQETGREPPSAHRQETGREPPSARREETGRERAAGGDEAGSHAARRRGGG